MNVTVRSADLSDPHDQQSTLALLDMYAQTPFGQSKPLADSVKQRLIPALQAVAGHRIFLAAYDGRDVGIAVCFPGFSTFRAQPLLNIHDVAVRPEARGKGVGRALLTAVERAAADAGCCRLTLEVRTDNVVARGLYESFGFETGDGNSVEHVFFSKDVAADSTRAEE